MRFRNEAPRAREVATDIDQDVKEAALECFGKLGARCGDTPALAAGIQECLPPFVERFRNEAPPQRSCRERDHAGPRTRAVRVYPHGAESIVGTYILH